tara:strand:- start:339 stop:683 length:345 start_codon:yes stop_codon:yes gene_type:complete
MKMFSKNIENIFILVVAAVLFYFIICFVLDKMDICRLMKMDSETFRVGAAGANPRIGSCWTPDGDSLRCMSIDAATSVYTRNHDIIPKLINKYGNNHNLSQDDIMDIRDMLNHK